MKKVLALLLAIIMVFALAACGQSAKPAEATAAAEAPAEEAPVEEAPAEEAPAEEVPAPEPVPAEAPADTGVTLNPDLQFTTMDSDGNEWTDKAFADAKVTMLNLWAYWCPPCCAELPDLQKLSEDYAEQGLRILGVSDVEFEADNIDKMVELGVTYPCLRLTESLDAVLNTGYVPSTIFVDSEGHILGEVIIGSKSYDGWAAIIEGYLN